MLAVQAQGAASDTGRAQGYGVTSRLMQRTLQCLELLTPHPVAAAQVWQTVVVVRFPLAAYSVAPPPKRPELQGLITPKGSKTALRTAPVRSNFGGGGHFGRIWPFFVDLGRCGRLRKRPGALCRTGRE